MNHPPLPRRPIARLSARAIPRAGLSLLEVMLAIAILGGALVVIGELMRIGSRSAAAARELTNAQLHCESKMAEVIAGIVPPEPIGPMPLEVDPDWHYLIETENSDQTGILVVRVTVEQELDARAKPLSFSLTRWMLDPQRAPPVDPAGGAASGTSSGTPAAGAASGAGS